MKKQENAFLILDSIRSAENVGSIFRTADAVGISKIYLAGYTPAPFDRFMRKNPKIAKTALGAEETIGWEKIVSTQTLLKDLKKENVMCIAIEQSESSIPYRKVNTRFPCAFVFGNEVEGLSEEVLALCDTIAEIPMMGKKESLNVAVAVGTALYQMLEV